MRRRLDLTLDKLVNIPGPRPRLLVAHTVKGHGVSFMADDNRWHYTRLTAKTYELAIARPTPCPQWRKLAYESRLFEQPDGPPPNAIRACCS